MPEPGSDPLVSPATASTRPPIDLRRLVREVYDRFGRGGRFLWHLLAIVILIDIAGCVSLGISMVPGPLLWRVATIVALLLLGGWYVVRGRTARIADLAIAVGLLLLATAVGSILSYVGMALAAPFADQWLANADASLGLDWRAYDRLITGMRWLEVALAILYLTSAPQIFVMVLLLSFAGQRRRLGEFVGLLVLTAIASVVIGALLPAAGAHLTHGIPDAGRAAYIADLQGIRSGSLRSLDLGKMTGLVTFPSFHTAISLIVMWCARGWRPVLIGAAMVNVPLLIGVPVFGSHFFVDMLAGAIITALTVPLWRWLDRPSRPGVA